jgi:hypothetical protein
MTTHRFVPTGSMSMVCAMFFCSVDMLENGLVTVGEFQC